MSRRPSYQVVWHHVPPSPGHDPLRAVGEILARHHIAQQRARIEQAVAQAKQEGTA